MAVDSDRWNRNIHYHHILLDLGPASSALDVGCGGGLLTRQLATICETVIGIDPHEPSIVGAESETSEKSVSYVLGDVLDYPFESGSFDLIVSVAALHHMDAETGLRRMADLIAPGGRLGIVGIGRSSFPRDLARDALAGATQIYKRAHGVKAWDHAPPMVWPPPLTDHQMKKLSAIVLPGSEFKRRIHGRHTITWTKQT
jgi:2-polyprenyl-3-methyl-5-hydroxy-6-metoxy-1,4-benzoquinol methylase